MLTFLQDPTDMSIPSSKTSQILHGGSTDPYHLQTHNSAGGGGSSNSASAEHLSQHHQQHLDQQSHNFTVENLMTAQQLHHENIGSSREPSPNQATPPLEEGGVASPYHSRPMSTNWPPPTNCSAQHSYEDHHHQQVHAQPQNEAAMEAAVANYRAWYSIPASSSPNVDPYHQSSTPPPPSAAISRDSYAAAAAAAAAAYRSSMFSAATSAASSAVGGHYNHHASSQQDCNDIPKY